MTPGTFAPEIEQLEAAGWQADKLAAAASRHQAGRWTIRWRGFRR